MKRHFSYLILIFASVFLNASIGLAGVTLEPFASISSTKAISPDRKNKTKENETLKERTTYGLRFGIGIYRAFKFQLALGTNQLVTTQKTQDAVDDFDQIDYKKDLDMDTSQPNNEVKITEKQNIGKVNLIVDPSFSIFVMRARAGVQATQRSFKKEETGRPTTTMNAPVQYKPTAGVGAGIKFGPRMFAMAEYGFFFYKFPDTKVFEREVSVSYGVSF